MAAWREGLDDPLIQEIIQFSRDHHLDLSVSQIFMNPWDIQVEERVDPVYVKKIAQALKEAGEWPETMPIPVVMGTGTVMIMDGSHRTTGARVAKLDEIPVLLVNADAYFLINQKYDIPMFDYVHSILPAVDPLMAENERKDEEGGKSKRRIAEPWDMEAFGDELSLGTARRGRIALPGPLSGDVRKNPMFVMVVKDRTGYNKSTIKYKKFEDLAAYAQQVIAPQIGEEFTNTLMQDNPLDWREQLEAMSEILQNLYSMEQTRVISAIEAWARIGESDNVGDTWIEYLG